MRRPVSPQPGKGRAARNRIVPALSGAEDFPLAYFDGYLWQGLLCRRVDYLAVGRVEDGAVTRAGELSSPVGDRAALVGTDRREGGKVPTVEVNQQSRLPRILELYGRSRRNVGGPGDGVFAAGSLL